MFSWYFNITKVYSPVIFDSGQFAKVYSSRNVCHRVIRESLYQKLRVLFSSRKFLLLKYKTALPRTDAIQRTWREKVTELGLKLMKFQKQFRCSCCIFKTTKNQEPECIDNLFQSVNKILIEEKCIYSIIKQSLKLCFFSWLIWRI